MTRRALFPLLPLLSGGCRREAPRRPPAVSDPPPAASPVPVRDGRDVIVAFGDSLTAGFGVDPGKSYPDFLQQELDRRGYRYRVVNEGVSGDTTSDGLARLEMVTLQQPAIVVVALGGNDGLRGLPVATTRANLKQILQTLREHRCAVVLAGMTLPPNYGREYVRSFEAVYHDLAGEFDVPLIPFLLEGVGGTQEFMQKDGLHANVAGNRRVAASVYKALEPRLRK